MYYVIWRIMLTFAVQMPDFIYNGKIYYNPVEFAMDRIGGAWKMPILWRLQDDKVMRYSELRKSISHISDKMLTTQLRELEADGYLERKVYAVVPPRTEYRLTERGRAAISIIVQIREYGLQLMREEGIEE
jgi:DNA-binding HxlR family transcriptional regulator